MYRESPGSLRYQLGMSLGAIRDATQQGETALKADLFQNTVTLCSPHLTTDEEEALRLVPPLPSRDRDGVAEKALNDAVERNLSRLLRIMASKSVYAYLQGEVGDASGLALTDEDEAESAGVRA